MRYEKAEEPPAMTPDADQGHADEDDRCHREGDDDLPGEGIAEGNEAEHVAEQDEHEQREDEREIALAVCAHRLVDHVADEFVGKLAQRLDAAGYELFA